MNDLIKAYTETNFTVYEPAIVIRVGQINSRLDELLSQSNETSWAYITAWNPYSEPTDKQMNEERNEQLRNDIIHYKFFDGEVVGTDPTWGPEKSFLIIGINKDEAITIGKKYRQNAIVAGKINEPAELLWIK
ncbi:MAG: DUF3293 domain-containing protein [Bacteroidetes bacterium]|nr:DUF3293 domain-containing protein [Bacteroidota bacterium]